MNESSLLKRIMIAISELGGRVFRNNVGYYETPDGRHIRYGVGGPGGSDLIGWTPHTITAGDIGRTIAIFTAIEVKTQTGRASPKQLAFLEGVRRAGGLALIVRSIEEIPGYVN